MHTLVCRMSCLLTFLFILQISGVSSGLYLWPRPPPRGPTGGPLQGRDGGQNKHACGVSREADSPLQQDVTSGCDITEAVLTEVAAELRFNSRMVPYKHTAGRTLCCVSVFTQICDPQILQGKITLKGQKNKKEH